MTTRPVGLTRDLPAARVMRARVDGTEIAVWRGSDGRIAAWNNRCPHRGMALSHGFVRGNTLACLYHGWHFDGTGRCRQIPAHPDLEPPETIHAQPYAVVETGGVIWVALEGAARGADTGLDPLRSFLVGAGEAAVMAAFAATPCNGTAPEGLKNGQVQIDGDRVAVLCNPVGPAQTQVTVLAGQGASVARRKTLSRWCEAARRAAEAEGGS